jgi:hypothetical protein
LACISKLSTIIQNVESQQEQNKERFKRELTQFIPQLEEDIQVLFDQVCDPKFLDGQMMTDKMFEILSELTNIEERFVHLEKTKDKYNYW